MTSHELAGKPAPRSLLVDVPRLVSAYYALKPDAEAVAERVAFGTSGHRGSSLLRSFNEDHILATSQAICEYRAAQGVTGPLFLGKDTHALSESATISALEVFAAAGVQVRIQSGGGYTPTPVISHAILGWNREHPEARADGVVVTPSHNPPEDGGFKYNPPHGGPADTAATRQIQDRANQILRGGLRDVQRVRYERALAADTTQQHDFVGPYVEDLAQVLDMDAIAGARLTIGADPLGGASVAFWEPIAERYRLNIEVVNPVVDPSFGFMTLDKDGRIRMDCSSPHAMAGLIALRERFDIAFGNDADADRHGIVTPGAGLMNPNHYLAVAIHYLFQNRPNWPAAAAIGKTLVSSSMIDRVAEGLGRRLSEVPVGFKWFVDGLLDGSVGFGGEESAGASFLRKDGRVWTTDKDGLLLDLLACEIRARSGKDPAELYAELVSRHGEPVYERLDAPATREQKQVLAKLSPKQVTASELAGEPILARLTRAPGNDAEIGGLKVTTANGWFAARPSGTEDVYKLYAESFLGPDHLKRIQDEAGVIVQAALGQP